ncbi:cytochrome C biogenesis protein [[Bacillus] enclensis]|uniref:Cytochrome c biogenesis protein n=1 Tax=[Bacillus] enclensis TaxID=1402860 RepID=A0A0V8HLG4_9BACI|nr:cytochrome c biogenesis protein ResB [[Bacillus] enclensis]QTC43371.1 cytochrome c biogenesis protein ResB [Bacillus sp. V3]QWC21540.1 cytochrome c biogenesis protein ResB [Bacillus haikouensis]KSU63515.1 cytochrome C biogenesis protein [[Bacillus] enclensis]MBH9968334.1 cytochrome c biogenesis protein ResB [[Bacillus] enclensis]SCB85276.1 cytochrome c biogenesis protein [[Bacillus] enclensis]
MKEIKCECGHVNPIGTILCESCGRALTSEAKKEKLHDMRYEGSARRSQTYNKSIVDKVWNFFSSVKVGVWLIIITLIASAVGTIFPQEQYIPSVLPPDQFYEEVYGFAGELYYTLGFHDLYGSWWYLLLIASIGVSLVICSLDRVIPLHRALKTQRVSRHESFLKRQRVYGLTKPANLDGNLEKIKKKLAEKKFKIREEDGNILAEKNRFSRWGPYVNHIGLIIFLIGGMLRFVPGMYIDETVWIREGEKKAVPGTHDEYYLENKEFTLENYDDKDKEVFQQTIQNTGTIAKNYQSDVVLYKESEDALPGEEAELKKEKEDSIKVNHPLKFENFAVYQTSYKLDEFKSMSFTFDNKESGKTFGEFTVDLFDPKDKYEFGDGYSIELMGYYPNFTGFNENGEPVSDKPVPDNPAFLFKMFSPDKPEGEISFVGIRKNLEPLGENAFKVSFAGVETRDVSALTVHKDLTLWILALGGAIFMIGVIQGAYWHHRRFWFRRTGDGSLIVAGHTNKGWFGLKNELKTILEGTDIDMPEDQQEKKEKDKEE